MNNSYKIKTTNKYRKNILINGQFNISQREGNKTFIVNNFGSLTDKWTSFLEGNLKVSGKQLSNSDRDIIELNNLKKNKFVSGLLLKCDQPSKLTHTDLFGIVQFIDDYEINVLNDKHCTISFWIKSSVVGKYFVALKFGLEICYITDYEIEDANVWEKKNITIKFENFLPKKDIHYKEKIFIYFGFRLGTKSQKTTNTNKWQKGNFYGNDKQIVWGQAASDNIALTGVQFESNYESTKFEYLPYEIELKTCQKFYKKPIEKPPSIENKKIKTDVRSKFKKTNVKHITDNESFIKITSGDLLLPTQHVSQNRLFNKETLKLIFTKPTKAVGGNFLEIKGKSYIHALKNINLSLKASDTIALIGHNGSGKTSLLKVCAGIYPLSGGERKHFGSISNFISQGLGANQEMSSVEYLEMQCVFRNYDTLKTQEIIKEVLSFVELGSYAFLPMRTYSTGMQARVFASAALFFPGDILLIDEGLSAGDSFFSKKFRTKIEKFYQESKILIAASHDDSFLKRWCTKGLVMKKGQIIYNDDISASLKFYHSKAYDEY